MYYNDCIPTSLLTEDMFYRLIQKLILSNLQVNFPYRHYTDYHIASCYDYIGLNSYGDFMAYDSPWYFSKDGDVTDKVEYPFILTEYALQEYLK